MFVRISHTTRFSYDAPAYQSHNEVRMRPLDDANQKCLEFALEVSPPGVMLDFPDYYGNRVHAFSIYPPHESLTIVARSLVERSDQPPIGAEQISFEEFLRDDRARIQREFDFLNPSAYVPFSDRMRKFFWIARPRADEEVGPYVQHVVAFVRDQFTYEPGITQVQSTADEILTIGAGVCQDFAHLTIAILRLAGVPARYVSGYLAPQDNSSTEVAVGSQASHAWIEAHLPGCGWAGYDPTHGCPTDIRHVRVAVGRDYSDVTPLRGVYRSFGSRQTMSVELKLERSSQSNQMNQNGYSQQ
jgi:transglutaminase-like putative cysteine protease